MIIQKVSSERAGARAGLRVGDRIVSVDGSTVRGERKNFDFYRRAAANFEPGRPIPIKVESQFSAATACYLPAV